MNSSAPTPDNHDALNLPSPLDRHVTIGLPAAWIGREVSLYSERTLIWRGVVERPPEPPDCDGEGDQNNAHTQRLTAILTNANGRLASAINDALHDDSSILIGHREEIVATVVRAIKELIDGDDGCYGG